MGKIRNLDQEHETARALTSDMRTSDDPRWIAVRSFLDGRGLDLTQCAIGIRIPEESGPFFVLVDPDRRSFSFEVQRVRKAAPLEVVLWRELHDDYDRVAYARGIFAAMAMLDSERSSDRDPLWVLVGLVRELTRPFRDDRLTEGTMFDGEGFWTVAQTAITDHGYAADGVAVLGYAIGTDLKLELALALPNAVAVDIGGEIDSGWERVTEVTRWQELSGPDAIRAYGELVTAGQTFLERG